METRKYNVESSSELIFLESPIYISHVAENIVIRYLDKIILQSFPYYSHLINFVFHWENLLPLILIFFTAKEELNNAIVFFDSIFLKKAFLIKTVLQHNLENFWILFPFKIPWKLETMKILIKIESFRQIFLDLANFVRWD